VKHHAAEIRNRNRFQARAADRDVRPYTWQGYIRPALCQQPRHAYSAASVAFRACHVNLPVPGRRHVGEQPRATSRHCSPLIVAGGARHAAPCRGRQGLPRRRFRCWRHELAQVTHEGGMAKSSGPL
jgi:hypothetical protein